MTGKHRQPRDCGMLWASVFLLVATVIAAGTALVVLDHVGRWVVG